MEFANTDKMNDNEIKLEMNSLLRMIRVLEWDKSKQQINPAKLDKLQSMKKRYEELESKKSQLVSNETL